MVYKSKSKVIVFLTLGLFFHNCQISLRLYRPFPQESFYAQLASFPQIKIQTPKDKVEIFAKLDHNFQSEKMIQNEYGNWKTIFDKEFTLRKHRYPALIGMGGEITIQEFELISEDTCPKNKISVKLKASIRVGKNKPSEFLYTDSKETYLSNCTFVGSTLTLIPLLVYFPYMGFQGNREDQLNQLGRNSFRNFFEFLEFESGGDPSKPDPKPTERPEEIDPKLKEILEEL